MLFHQAVHALYNMAPECDHSMYHPQSPLMSWIAYHGRQTLNTFLGGDAEKRIFNMELAGKQVKVHIDPKNNLPIQDQLSQVHI